MKSRCYKCHRIGNTDEHVPPKCLFPERKDLPTKNFRVNLITVPSCEIHNLKKTSDDEFLMIALASSVQANQYGFYHFSSKVKRALNRKNKNFLNEIIVNYEPIEIINSAGEVIKTLKGKANVKRLYDCFDHIVYGLYRHQFKSNFRGKLTIMNDFIQPRNKNEVNLIQLIKKVFIKEPRKKNIQVHNPEIFNYQFTNVDRNGIVGLKMSFYEELNVFVSLEPEGNLKPIDFAMSLLNDGLKVTFKFDDGDITFNEKVGD